MLNEQIKNEIKSHFKEYLQEQGIPTEVLFKCINPEHSDNDPSMSYDKKGNILHCFGCKKNYDIISLYAMKNNLDEKKDFMQIMNELAIKYNVDIKTYSTKSNYSEKKGKEDFTKYFNKCKKNIDKTDYLEKRGISQELINKYNIGYDITKKHIVLPISKTYYEARATEENSKIKHIKPKGLKNELFNYENLKDSDFKTIIWVTEAIIDAMSLEEVNNSLKTISLNSINNSLQLVNEAKQNNFKGTFILALDTDPEGLNASKDLKEDLEAVGIKCKIFNNNIDKYNFNLVSQNPVINKDINDFLISNREKLKNDITNFNDLVLNMLEAEALNVYQQENALNFLDEFSRLTADEQHNKPTSTGIELLDEALEGGFYKKNLVILGAISSLGKTTLALQIADNIAQKGNDILIFSLEMSKEELIAKSLSRLTYLNSLKIHYTGLALTTREILKGRGTNEDIPNNEQQRNIYNEAFTEYKEQIAQKIYITECNSETDININTINEKIKNHIKITGNKPFVVIDYLQIIQNQEKGLTDKQAIDKIVTSLKRVARDNDITILLISAFNRNSYNSESSLSSFLSSSSIEYTSDVLISLQPQVLDGKGEDTNNKIRINKEQQKTDRDLTLKILKNRNGKIADIKNIVFHAKYNYMDFKD